MPRGWHSRGYLPHFDGGQIAQFITWRLADAVPRGLLRRWTEELSVRPPEIRRAELFRQVEAALDLGHGSRLLAEPANAGIIRDELLRGDGTLYELHAWVVMPTHVHCLITPLPDVELSEIVRQWKGRSSFQIGQLRTKSGPVWAPDYFDRFIRNEDHFARTVYYIVTNPVKAGLCESAEEWRMSSGFLGDSSY